MHCLNIMCYLKPVYKSWLKLGNVYISAQPAQYQIFSHPMTHLRALLTCHQYHLSCYKTLSSPSTASPLKSWTLKFHSDLSHTPFSPVYLHLSSALIRHWLAFNFPSNSPSPFGFKAISIIWHSPLPPWLSDTANQQILNLGPSHPSAFFG